MSFSRSGEAEGVENRRSDGFHISADNSGMNCGLIQDMRADVTVGSQQSATKTPQGAAAEQGITILQSKGVVELYNCVENASRGRITLSKPLSIKLAFWWIC